MAFWSETSVNEKCFLPQILDDISEHLCDRVLNVLFVIWLMACHKSFPSPSLWKTFRNMCLYWRHHEALVTMWHRVNHTLTASMLKMMYGPDFPEMSIGKKFELWFDIRFCYGCIVNQLFSLFHCSGEEESQLLPADMSSESIAQCWFRFLHILQNPVDLSRPSVVSNTPKFLQYALTCDAVVDPSYHPCLSRLPFVFLRAMKGISAMVNAFLGNHYLQWFFYANL